VAGRFKFTHRYIHMAISMTAHPKLPGLHAALPAKGSPMLSTRFVEPKTPLLQDKPGRRRIWELHNTFHCSVIGTCLTTGELRHTLEKLALPGIDKETDHQLHGRAVGLACRHEIGAKLLQKALDRRHATVIKQFSKARTSADVDAHWCRCVAAGDIPGAYWAVLTHPETDETLAKKAFGEVHMLSHLVGSANRADIRRLRDQELRINALEEKVRRQEFLLKEASRAQVARAGEIRSLEMALDASKSPVASPQVMDPDLASLSARLHAETRRADRLALRLGRIEASLREQAEALHQSHHQIASLTRELDASEEAWHSAFALSDDQPRSPLDLGGVAVLYVGGRPHQTALLRSIASLWNVDLLHHDGGVDERMGRLEALIARATITMFPVDCVSHNAAGLIKRASAQSGKTYVPLRSSGVATFVAALNRLATDEASEPAVDSHSSVCPC
jgi:hypothetical protein